MRIVLEEREKREIQTSTKARTNPRSV
jgi:hypothetical protein